MLCDQSGSGKSKMAAEILGKTWNGCISTCMWDRNEIQTANPTLYGTCDLMDLLRISYSQTGSGKSKMAATSWDTSTSGLMAAILNLTLPVQLYSTLFSPVWLPVPQNMGLALGISLLSCSQADLQVLPVWRSPSCILDFRLYAVVSLMTGALGCWTTKI